MNEKKILTNGLTNMANRNTTNAYLDKMYHQKRKTDLLHFKTLKIKFEIKK